MTVAVQFACETANLPDTATIVAWVDTVVPDERQNAEVTIRMVTEEEGRDLNHQFRGFDKPTNVLSFPSDIPTGVQIDWLGDVVICAPVVTIEAEQQSKPLHAHYAHLVVHGVLHLLGYDHIDDDEAQVMEAKERDILATLGFTDPYRTEC